MLPDVLYECKNCSVILRKEYRSRVFEKRVQIIFGVSRQMFEENCIKGTSLRDLSL
jgi:hypothetical protein